MQTDMELLEEALSMLKMDIDWYFKIKALDGNYANCLSRERALDAISARVDIVRDILGDRDPSETTD